MKKVEDFIKMLKERGMDYAEKCKRKKIYLNDNILLSDNVVEGKTEKCILIPYFYPCSKHPVGGRVLLLWS